MWKKICFIVLILIGLINWLFNKTEWDEGTYINPYNVNPIDDSQHYPVIVNTFDSLKNDTTMIFKEKPKRVITDELNPFETLLALKQGDRIVGTSVEFNSDSYRKLMKKYPKELEKVKRLNYYDLDMETVLSSDPDFILGWKGTFSGKRLKPTYWWNQRGVNTYIVATANHILENGTIEDECRFINDMGQIFNASEETNQMISQIRQEIYRVRGEIKGQRPQKVMVIELSGRSIMNYDSGWIVGDMVQQLGGFMPVKANRIGYEDLIYEDPDVIFVNYFNDMQKKGIQQFFEQPAFNSLKAVRNHRIYLFPFDCLYTPGIKTIDGIRIVRDGLYPDLAGT